MNFEIYCDESRQDLFHTKPPGEHYVLIGGIWIKKDKRSEYKEAIKALRRKHNLRGEFKWKRVSPSRMDFYRELVDFFFDESADDMRFRVLVLRAEEMDAARFSQSDNELMFYKFYYQLLHHWILDCNDYTIFLDSKTNRRRDRLKTLRQCLQNSNLTSKVSIQALPSRQVDLLQLTDVLIGAVGYRFHGETKSSAKTEIITSIEKRVGRQISPTTKAEEKFNVFRFRPGGGW